MELGPVVIYRQHPYGGMPVPPAGPSPADVPVDSRTEPTWPTPELPGERDERVWDPFDPPLYG